MFKYLLIAVMLSSCVSTSNIKIQSSVFVNDPDPLCRFKKEPTSIELLDRILSNRMFKSRTVVVVPYRPKEPVLLNDVSFKVCSL